MSSDLLAWSSFPPHFCSLSRSELRPSPEHQKLPFYKAMTLTKGFPSPPVLCEHTGSSTDTVPQVSE
ncbi:hypothetical protein Cadr_000026216 [Camelus dromedarius]|uniref:Uncharacterized protein n=1 Tax=Camelus dromedarius TaxID=9838 RepID=A0A5N4CGB1_CAMDR|nr:hypothetical protein Cadr_000026216 [Camelus dromedarius]